MTPPPKTDIAKIRKYCEARVPARLRHKVRIEATARGNSVTIFDCRPPWHPNLTEWSKVGEAQLRYSASTHHWSLYWGDRNGLVALVINKEEQVFGGGFATMARALLFGVPESAAAEKRFWTLKLAEATLYWTEGHENGLMPDAQFGAIMPSCPRSSK